MAQKKGMAPEQNGPIQMSVFKVFNVIKKEPVESDNVSLKVSGVIIPWSPTRTDPTFRASMSKCKASQLDVSCGAMLEINRILFGSCMCTYIQALHYDISL